MTIDLLYTEVHGKGDYIQSNKSRRANIKRGQARAGLVMIVNHDQVEPAEPSPGILYAQ